MSVLNQSGEEQVECPLCMEPLEVDDLNFYPCTCGYQICRFCWHRIRTDENGLCPACRKAYSEDPADFIPLSQEQVAKLKAEKRQRDQQRKAKLSESRKHLASVRVVQRNLVFVVGLPMRLADAEVLKKHEYFGKFGKIHKVVINQSTAYAGSQGPSASAYVTYMKSDDALRAIQSVNNITIDGRLVKSSLGTTKYCSHFMKNQPCPKPDCMYLHDFGNHERKYNCDNFIRFIGDPEASFTKEQMHAGKHQEYEKKLHDALLQKSTNNNSTNSNQNTSSTSLSNGVDQKKTTKETATNKENWPQLNNAAASSDKDKKVDKTVKNVAKPNKVVKEAKKEKKLEPKEECLEKLTLLDDNSSFFSHNTFQKIIPEEEQITTTNGGASPPSLLTDSLPDINTTEDWAAVFGFPEKNRQQSPPIDSFFHSDDFSHLIEKNGYTTPKSNLDQHMSKFFTDFHQKNGQKEAYMHQNGFNLTNYMMLLQQKRIEDQLMNISLKQQQHNFIQQHNGFMNGGDVPQNGYNGYQNGMLLKQQQQQQQQRSRPVEDDLGFDPFQETQKALAELIANEQSYKAAHNVRSGMNGLVHNNQQQQQNKSYLPPPPPGFVQPTATTHMNSFGSKILPFLNMSNQQQQQQQHNWPSYNNVQQHKNLNSSDWKDFDSAIVTTSRHYPLMPQMNNFGSLRQGAAAAAPPTTHLRQHEYNTNAFSNFTQQIQQQQPNFNNYSSQQQQPNLSWFTSELNTQISSPPGFRTNQTSKQQEC